ncbi:hypothetical protein [Flavobacterium sp. ZS1P14]|uniref:hypothetical protein n=1 Tax=Flavobacterium sp. ZS1P14 TaxID=3401729 RepID=UPI003AB05985
MDLKPLLFFLLFLNLGSCCSAQNFQLRLIGNTKSETKTIDSLQYHPNHKNTKSLQDEIIRITAQLAKIGFIENSITENLKINDTSYVTKLTLGNRIKTIHIYIGRNNEVYNAIVPEKTKDTIVIRYEETEAFLQDASQKLEQKGFALASVKLANIQNKKQTLYADLAFTADKKRKLNAIEIKYAENSNTIHFPKGYLAQINRNYQNKIFNQNIVNEVHHEFEKFKFANQVKYPEILFTEDSTKIYVYLEKRKSNTFDGFIGFSNNENKKIIFNGYADITLENTLRAGEQFSLFWKSDGNRQKTFKTSIEVPYAFKSPIGLKASLTIFKQDSTYQNTKTGIDLGYFIHYNTRIYLGYQATESSDIQNTNSEQLRDYKNSFLTTAFEYTKNDTDNSLFQKKSTLSLLAGLGKRNSSNPSETTTANKQFYVHIEMMHNFYLNQKNCINLRSQNYYLQSDTYIINELFRFGGINSIRGFEENSFQANFLTSILTEYRYILSPSLYIHSIIDYAIYKDKSNSAANNQKTSLAGLGLGLGLQTKNGLLKLAFANGTIKNQNFNFYNTIIHICYNVKF